MRYDGDISRFLARAYNVLKLSIDEQDKINEQLPKYGQELPAAVQAWIKSNRAKVNRLTPSWMSK